MRLQWNISGWLMTIMSRCGLGRRRLHKDLSRSRQRWGIIAGLGMPPWTRESKMTLEIVNRVHSVTGSVLMLTFGNVTTNPILTAVVIVTFIARFPFSEKDWAIGELKLRQSAFRIAAGIPSWIDDGVASQASRRRLAVISKLRNSLYF